MITYKSDREIELMRHAGHIAMLAHEAIKNAIKPGITTKELDTLAESFIRSNDAIPSFKNYNGFPASICTSINNEVVHGIPGKIKLKNGDIITIDVVIGYKGYQGDAAWTYAVGNVDDVSIVADTDNTAHISVGIKGSGTTAGDRQLVILMVVPEALPIPTIPPARTLPQAPFISPENQHFSMLVVPWAWPVMPPITPPFAKKALEDTFLTVVLMP